MQGALRIRPGQQPEETALFHQLPQAKPPFDVSKHYVRFRELRPDGYVLFDFAIGDPELAVELTLPLAAYQAFCRERAVIYLTREQAETIDFERSKWRYGSPGLTDYQAGEKRPPIPDFPLPRKIFIPGRSI